MPPPRDWTADRDVTDAIVMAAGPGRMAAFRVVGTEILSSALGSGARREARGERVVTAFGWEVDYGTGPAVIRTACSAASAY